MADTVGKQIAERAVALRKKYGQYPVTIFDEDLKEHVTLNWPESHSIVSPLEGHEEDVIPPCPDFPGMKPKIRDVLPINRADFRRRYRPLMPRSARLNTFSRKLHQGDLER